MKNPLMSVIAICFVLITGSFSFSQIVPGTQLLQHDMSFWGAVFPLRNFDSGGCSYSLPKPLAIQDKDQTDFVVTFQGGKRMGGVYERSKCNGLSGYVSRQFQQDDPPMYQTSFSDTVTITFSKPVTLERIRFQTKTPATYQIIINNTISNNYQPPARLAGEHEYPYRYPFFVGDTGSSGMGFESSDVQNVVQLTIKSLDTAWAFGIDRIDFRDLAGGSGGGGIPTPTYDGNPVIFVPGVAGSELVKANEGSKWLPQNIFSLHGDISSLALPSEHNIYATDVFYDQNYLNNNFQPQSYFSILNALYNNGIGPAYDVGGDPSRRTTNGCDMSQNSENPTNKPKTFIFAYDWRKSNAETSIALKDYVGCVRKFYPDRRIDIIAHSMGGLVARRYVLDNPDDHQVEKVITIGTPWLGAPKAIHALETGVFIAPAFGADMWDWAANMVMARTLRNVMKTFPGPLQLLPSDYYFDLHYSDLDPQIFPTPLSIRKYPWSNTENYNYSQMRNWLDSRFDIQPGKIVNQFHQIDHEGLQDDWRQDSSLVNYYHIYGQQRSNLTVGKVRVLQNTYCNLLSLNCIGGITNTYFEPIPTNGDGTVPLISSRRISLTRNLNSNKVKRYLADAKSSLPDNPFDDHNTEHTKITANENVHATLLKILKDEDSPDTLIEEDDDTPILSQLVSNETEDPSFYISLQNIEGFNASVSAPPTFGASGPNGMQAIPMNDNSAWIAMPAMADYRVSFFGNGSPIEVRVLKGVDYDRVEEFNKYVDLIVPENTLIELAVSPWSSPQLRYDSNSDGFPETLILPTITETGANASDMEAPVISFEYQENGGGKLVTLSATDNLSGVRKIYYSLDGTQFSEYATPIQVAGNQSVVYVFAEDNNFNRTGVAPLDIVGTSYSIGNRVWYDINNDGKINHDPFLRERGIDNVSLSLFLDANSDGQPDNVNQPVKTTTSDAEGYYRFDDLNPGSYVVRVNPSNFADDGVLVGFLNTALQVSGNIDSDATNAGENGILPSGVRNNVQNVGVLSNTITLGPTGFSEPIGETDLSPDDQAQIDGYSNLTIDFGFYRLGLSGTVWVDNGVSGNADNGILDFDENGLAGRSVRIFKINGDEVIVGPDGILGTSDDAAGGVLTDAEGNYSFQGLDEGDYVVKVERLGANSSSQSSVSPNDNIDYDNNGYVGSGNNALFLVSPSITLTPGSLGVLENTTINEFKGITDNTTLDFGVVLIPTVSTALVAGQVTTSSSNGISNAKVTITNASTGVYRSVSTNAFGYFTFADVEVGELYIFSVSHRHHSFTPQTLTVWDNIDDLLFVALP